MELPSHIFHSVSPCLSELLESGRWTPLNYLTRQAARRTQTQSGSAARPSGVFRSLHLLISAVPHCSEQAPESWPNIANV